QPVANNIRMNRHINMGTIDQRRRQSLKPRNITSITFATSARLPLKLQPIRKHLINRLNLPNPLTATKKDLNRPTMRPRTVNMGTVTKLNAVSWLQNLRAKIRNRSHRTILRENLRPNLYLAMSSPSVRSHNRRGMNNRPFRTAFSSTTINEPAVLIERIPKD